MGQLRFEISMSLDGYVAGPGATLEEPLGQGGERLHEWVVGLAAWREGHGLSGGDVNPDSQLLEESLARTGATIMGRRMFSNGAGSWENDPRRDGWWGDEPPFGHPVFILTHHPRASEEKQGGTTFNFVTDGIEAALDQARSAAGDKDVAVAGGAQAAQQYLRAGLLDEMLIHLVPIFLGDGVRLFEDTGEPELELKQVIHSPAVTHLRYRVVK
jgi:dihydrofolate reductase